MTPSSLSSPNEDVRGEESNNQRRVGVISGHFLLKLMVSCYLRSRWLWKMTSSQRSPANRV
jgi:hypothetical protein